MKHGGGAVGIVVGAVGAADKAERSLQISQPTKEAVMEDMDKGNGVDGELPIGARHGLAPVARTRIHGDPPHAAAE